MLRVADHINAMKKKYDAATVVQELQHLLHGWEVSHHNDRIQSVCCQFPHCCSCTLYLSQFLLYIIQVCVVSMDTNKSAHCFSALILNE